MSIFGTIMSKILGASQSEAAPASTGGAAPSAPAPTSETAQPDPAGSSTASSGAPSASTAGPAAANVDVAAVLDGMAEKAGQKLDWRHSIVDLMKLVGMDSGLSARKELAHELHYTGDTNDSASMNMWLHKEVMKKLAENGGKLPADLH